MTYDSDYRFGSFELLVRRQRLVHAGAPVRIGSRAIALLTALVAGAGDLVTREKLIAAAWPTTFVEESNLKVNIANLRRALASSDPGPDYIENVPGRGYRFVAPVQRVKWRGGLPSRRPMTARTEGLAAFKEWLGNGPVVTVIGADGVGNAMPVTAAGRAVSGTYDDAISLVDLAKVSAAEFIPAAIASALGRRTNGEDTLAEVIGALDGGRKLLLIVCPLLPA